MFGFIFHALSIRHMELKSTIKRVDGLYGKEEQADKREYARAVDACQVCNILHSRSIALFRFAKNPARHRRKM